jgi:hypothetical protein
MAATPDHRSEVYFTFSDLADYIFKLPRFLDPEIEIEREKLWSYFPKSDDPEQERRNAYRRRLRFEREFGNLLVRFPRFMSAANLMLACSVFEHKFLMICRSHPSFAGHRNQAARQGVSRLFGFLASIGIDLKSVDKHEQVQVAILFRNCLVHANGLLALSRDEDRIRSICDRRQFVEMERRQSYDPEGKFWRAKIEEREGGDTLVTSNNYAFVCCAHFRSFLMDILARPSLGMVERAPA